MLCKYCAHDHVCEDCEVAAEKADFKTMSETCEDEPGLGSKRFQTVPTLETIREHYKGGQECVIGHLVADVFGATSTFNIDIKNHQG
jgi:hypothetical protein